MLAIISARLSSEIPNRDPLDHKVSSSSSLVSYETLDHKHHCSAVRSPAMRTSCNVRSDYFVMEINASSLRDKLLHQCRDTIDSLQADLDSERQLRDTQRDELAQLKEAHSTVLEELHTFKAKAALSEANAIELKGMFNSLQKQELELRARNVHLTSINEGLNRQLHEQSNNTAKLREALANAEREGSAVKDMLETAEAKLRQHLTENEALKSTLSEMSERQQTTEQLSEREAQDLKFRYDCKIKVLAQEHEEKYKLQAKLDKQKLQSAFENKLNNAKKEISDFYEEQLSHMRHRLDTLSKQLEDRHKKAIEMEEALTRTRETETHRSLNWEEKSSKYVIKASKYQADLQEMNEKYAILLDKHNEAKAETHKLKVKAKALEGEKAKLLSDLECLKAEAEAVILERNSVTDAARELERANLALKSDLKAVVKADEAKQGRIIDLEEERDALMALKHHNQQRIQELEQKLIENTTEVRARHSRLSSRDHFQTDYAVNVEEYVQIIDQLNEDRARLANAIEQLEVSFKSISVKFNRERSSREALTKELNECMRSLNQERVQRQLAERELFRVSASPVSSELLGGDSVAPYYSH